MSKLLVNYLLVSVLSLIAMALAIADSMTLMFAVAFAIHTVATIIVLAAWRQARAGK